MYYNKALIQIVFSVSRLPLTPLTYSMKNPKNVLFLLFSRVNSKPTNQRSSSCIKLKIWREFCFFYIRVAKVEFWNFQASLSSKKFHHLAQQLKMRRGGIFRTLSKLRHFLANQYTEVMQEQKNFLKGLCNVVSEVFHRNLFSF